MNEGGYMIHPIGVVRSELKNREDAPMQGYEGAPDAWIVIAPEVAQGLDGIAAGSDIIMLTWLHRADRETAYKLLDRIQEKHTKGGVVTGATTSITRSGGSD